MLQYMIRVLWVMPSTTAQFDVDDWRDIVAISAGYTHTVGLKKDGTVVSTNYREKQTWDHGECNVDQWRDIIAISAGTYHTVGLKRDGTVVATKFNDMQFYNGQCDVDDWRDIVAVSAGDHLTVGLKSDGTVVATKYIGKPHEAGFYDDWKFGDIVSKWRDIIYIKACEDRRVIGIKRDRTIITTDEKSGEVHKWRDIVAFDDSIGLMSNGKVMLSGDDNRNQWMDKGFRLFHDYENLEQERATATKEEHIAGKKREEERRIHIKHLAAIRNKLQKAQGLISNHELALQCDGTLINLFYDRILASEIVCFDISSYGKWVGLKEDGTVVVSEDSEYDVKGWRNITAVGRSESHVVGLKSDGTVVATGDNHHGECNVDSWNDIVAISVSDNLTVGLKSDGTVVATGSCDEIGEIDKWRDIVLIRTDRYKVAALKADGTVVTTKYGTCEWKKGWCDIVDLCMSDFHIVGLKADGTVVAESRLDSYNNACCVEKWEDIVAISAGTELTVGLKSDGTVVYEGHGCWTVYEWKDIIAISAGYKEALGLRKDGVVFRTDSSKSNFHYDSKLFENFDTLEQEKQAARQTREEEKRIKLEEEKRLAERRRAGKCQHCGSDFKGFFTKKCVSCNKPKDY